MTLVPRTKSQRDSSIGFGLLLCYNIVDNKKTTIYHQTCGKINGHSTWKQRSKEREYIKLSHSKKNKHFPIPVSFLASLPVNFIGYHSPWLHAIWIHNSTIWVTGTWMEMWSTKTEGWLTVQFTLRDPIGEKLNYKIFHCIIFTPHLVHLWSFSVVSCYYCCCNVHISLSSCSFNHLWKQKSMESPVQI